MMVHTNSNDQPCVVSINISRGGIPKLPVDQVTIEEAGLVGDGHNHDKHYRPIQAVCLQDIEKLQELKSEGYPLDAGTTGENLTVRYLDVNSLQLGDQLEFTEGVILEISKVRKPCYVLDAIDPQLKTDIVGRCGMYAKVIQPGIVSVGERIEVKSNSQNTIQNNSIG